MTIIPMGAVLGPRAPGDSTESNQSIMQHLYFIVAVIAVLLLVSARISVLRRRNQPISDFFRIGSSRTYPYGSGPVNSTSYGSAYQPGYGVPLAPVPAVYRPDRRVRAADTDAEGRRLGPAGEDWDGKDILPAYDNISGPPKYVETDWRNVGSQGRPQQPLEQSINVPPPLGVEGNEPGIRPDDTPSGEQPSGCGQAGATPETEVAAPPLVPLAHHDVHSS
ncbi:hypothetical protein BS17DRAFT_788501 [Gyrodon lividus]|nr:hypothetical protein BS17DRAFT_788501 [Gyrodon lividus]